MEVEKAMSYGYATLPKAEMSKVPGRLEIIGIGGERILVQGDGLPDVDISAPPHFASIEEMLAAMDSDAEEPEAVPVEVGN
jgi:hypothetical protein